MRLENILSPEIIQNKQKYVKKEFSSFLELERFNNRNNDSDLINNYYTLYLSGFYGAKDVLIKDVHQLDDSLQRMYFSAISSSNLINNIQENNTHNFFVFPFNFNSNFKSSDYETNLRLLQNLSNKLKHSHNDALDEIYSYFYNLNNTLNSNLNGFIGEKQLDLIKPREKVQEKKLQKIWTSKSEESIDIENISFVNTKKEDIIGNKDIKDNLENSMIKLFLYNSDKKMNPALYKKQFKQKYLLVGEPGNGKGMLAAYAATIGKNIAQQKNKEFKILTLENNSSYQDGPILKLLENFKNINNKDNHYLIILDEIDSMFTSRLDNKTQNYQKKLVTELLKFTDNSVEYLNKGNYVLISMTNMPNQLDPAFLSRMNKCTYICEGPKTKKEKISLMKKLLYDMIPEDKILIDNWDAIGSAAHDLNLSGRELNGCIENLFEESAISKIPVNLIDKSYDEQIDFFNNFKTITQRNLLSEIIKTNDRRRLDNYLLKGGLYVNS